jgi:AbrB family looped-hinge helix DNA binding protein
MQCHVKIGEGGRLIIPAVYRKALDLKIGDELILRLDDGELRLFRQLSALQKIQSIAKSKSKQKNHTDDFIAFRKKDEE